MRGIECLHTAHSHTTHMIQGHKTLAAACTHTQFTIYCWIKIYSNHVTLMYLICIQT